MAKAVAKLTYAFADATVPKVNVIIGQAYGSAYVAMNSKAIGADVTFAWPTAEIGSMDAKHAAQIMYDGKGADVINEKAAEYASLQTSAQGAARRGYVDSIIEACDTRKYVIGAFEMLYTKREDRPSKKTWNSLERVLRSMKKRFLVLTMIACILGLTACGSEKTVQTSNKYVTKEEVVMAAESICDYYAAEVPNAIATDPDLMEDASIATWVSGLEELGNYVGVIQGETEVTFNEENIVATVQVQGDQVYKDNKNRTATVEIIFMEDFTDFENMSVNINYDMSELMTNAGLNTLLGMGTVFIVLILISLIISCFNFIPKIQEAFAKKAKKEDVKAEAVDNTIAQIVEKEEADDLELIAVISAAIAASEGATSTDGFVVRSIIRR